MASTDKVIFDTNAIRNEGSPDTFLGGRSELKKFEKVASILIPEIVIEEVRNQKRKILVSKRDSFVQNIFHKIRNIDENETKNFDIDDFISVLEQSEEINYSVIKLTDYVALLPEFKSMALSNSVPFEKDSDKGFKDAYIYFTILEYLKTSEDRFTYFVTKDSRLKEVFECNPRVQVITDFDDFEEYRAGYFREDYFIDKMKADLDNEILIPEDVSDVWLNINGNWVVKIISEESTYFIEVDFATKEIITKTSKNFAKGIEMLVSSGNFQTTHTCVDKLTEYMPFFSDEDIVNILESAVRNNQIYWLASDEDVKVFVKTLFESKIGNVPEEIVVDYKNYYE